MRRGTRRLLRVVFATVGSLAAVLGVGTLSLVAVLRPNLDPSLAIRGSVLYLAIAAASFFAVRRLRAPRQGPPDPP